MSIPSIYCDKKEVPVGGEVTLTANLGNGVWDFENATIGDEIIMLSGTVYSSEITFKCITTIDPLIINYFTYQNLIHNGIAWVDSDDDNLANYWYGSSNQTNHILTGYKFNGQSQRATLNTNGIGYIAQRNISIQSSTMTLEFMYRSTQDIEVSVDTFNDTTVKTEDGSIFPIYPLLHGAGDFEFAVINGANVRWVLSDGTFSNNNIVNKTLPAGTSYLIVDDFSDVEVYSFNTKSNYIGNLSDVPSDVQGITLRETGVLGSLNEITHVTKTVDLNSCTGVEGNIVSLTNVEKYIDVTECGNVFGNIKSLRDTSEHVGCGGHPDIYGNFGALYNTALFVNASGCNIDGDIATLVGTSDYINLSHPTVSENVYGDIAHLYGTDTIILDNTAVSGRVVNYSIGTYWALDDTSLTKGEITQSLINIAGHAVSNGIYDGYFKCKHNMAYVIDDDFDSYYPNRDGIGLGGEGSGYELYSTIKVLEYLGWTILVNYKWKQEWEDQWEDYRCWWLNYYATCYWNDGGGDWICTDNSNCTVYGYGYGGQPYGSAHNSIW